MIIDRELYRKHLKEAFDYIKSKIDFNPVAGIILGTGLGGLVKEIEIEKKIPYGEIPHFPVSTVESHEGYLIFGRINGKKIMAMQGRFHYYEGYSMQQITFPVRIMKMMGVASLLISNAAGGMNPEYRKGDLAVIIDHINLLGSNPLIGQNLDEFGPRFPDMSEPYSKRLMQLAEQAAGENGIKIHQGVFVAVSGPNLETKAEYKFLRNIGADIVGMSTVPENIVAVHMGLEVMAVSVITDECFPDMLEPVNVDEIIAIANKAEPKLTTIMKEVIKRL
ncbi:MAG: purine-nucleoside phosphorylase [Calditrichaeota bacterium]|nr:MAG: purine-nucleoside phosphorylase [Calditrichota bacterium]